MFVNNYKTIKKFQQLGYFQDTKINYVDTLNKLGGIKDNSGNKLNGFYTYHTSTSSGAISHRYLFALNKNNIFNLSYHNYKYGIKNSSCDTSAGLYLALGSGTGEVNEEDYTLFSPFTYKTDYEGIDNDKIVINLNEDGTVNQLTLTYCFKALKDITITETGLTHSVAYYSGSSSNPSCKPCLLSHELLDEPMTFAKDEIFTIEYTVEIPLE